MKGLCGSWQISFPKKIMYVTYKLDLEEKSEEKRIRDYVTKLEKEKDAFNSVREKVQY